MAKNKIKEVAQLLGLELEEEFGIRGTANRYKFTKNGLMWSLPDDDEWYPAIAMKDLIIGELTIVKLPILNSAEKAFLSAIIDSVKDRVIYIKRCLGGVYSSYIDIHLESYINAIDGEIIITSNCFENETMFSRMELDRKYTLEELGL